MMHCTRPLYGEALKTCDKTADIFKQLDDYYVKWESQPDADKKKEDNYKKNKEAVDKDYGYIEKTWKEGVFFDSGMFSGRAEVLLEGKPGDDVICTPPKRDQSSDKKEAAGQFASGWLYGITTMDERDYIMGCMEENDLLNNFLYSAFEHYFAGDEKMGDAMMHCTRDLYATALRKCDKVTDTF